MAFPSVYCLLAFFLVWLGSAADYRPYTHTITPFQYIAVVAVVAIVGVRAVVAVVAVEAVVAVVAVVTVTTIKAV